MNIFAVDRDPEVAGTVLPDKLMSKMTIEAAQMISTAVVKYRPWTVHNKTWKLTYRYAHLSVWFAFWCRCLPIYAPAHPGHPCTLWTGATQDNFIWHVLHGLAIAAEYTRRYGKVHKSQAIIERASQHCDWIPDGDLQPFAQAMPDEMKHATDPTIAYRNFMKTKPYWGEKAFRKGRDFTDFYTNLTTTVPEGR